MPLLDQLTSFEIERKTKGKTTQFNVKMKPRVPFGGLFSGFISCRCKKRQCAIKSGEWVEGFWKCAENEYRQQSAKDRPKWLKSWLSMDNRHAQVCKQGVAAQLRTRWQLVDAAWPSMGKKYKEKKTTLEVPSSCCNKNCFQVCNGYPNAPLSAFLSVILHRKKVWLALVAKFPLYHLFRITISFALA